MFVLATCREYLSVKDVTAILQHFKGIDIVAVPIGPDKILDGIGIGLIAHVCRADLIC